MVPCGSIVMPIGSMKTTTIRHKRAFLPSNNKFCYMDDVVLIVDKPSQFFDDTFQYHNIDQPGSPINPNTGTTIRIASISAKGNFMQLLVYPSR